MDTITECLALLALDNGRRMLAEAADMRLGYGLCGAVILDLIQMEALSLKKDGTLVPQPDMEPGIAYLQEALTVIPRHTPMEQGAVLLALYAILPGLKERVWNALAAGGHVQEDIIPLKWSFAFRSYALNPEYAGYRARLLKGARSGTIRPQERWALYMASACDLLGRRKGLKLSRGAREDIKPVMQVAAHMTDLLPDTIARSNKQPRMGKKTDYPTTWEWRGFWPETDSPTLIRADKEYSVAAKRACREAIDHYIIIEGVPDNIKCRKAALEVKKPVETRDGHTAFRAKRRYPFPLSARTVAEIFPRLGKKAKPVKDAEALCRLLNERGMRAVQVEVRKSRFQVRLKSCVKVELCTLEACGRKYLSACVEGPDYAVTQAQSHNFRTGDVREMSYVEFLKHRRMENVP